MLDLHNKLLSNIFYGDGKSYEIIKDELDITYYTDGSFYNEDKKHKGLDSVERLLIAIKSAFEDEKNQATVLFIFNTIYKFENKAFGSYFRNLYQILKLIKNSFPDIDVQKKYSNILRAQLSNQELSLLLLNCLCPHVDNGQFRKLVIHFELLEHLNITYTLGSDYIATFTINNPTMHLTSNEIDLYFSTDTSGKLIKSAFGQNAQIISYCKDRNYIDENI